MTVRVLCDCGNSTVKLVRDGDPVRLEPAAVPAWLAAHPAAALVLLPGAARTADIVRRAWTGRLLTVGHDLPLPDLGQYPGMGLDRIVAGIAAGPSCIVVDAGTATTLTAWNGDGRFAGGLILPGARTMVAGLSAAAPALPMIEPLGPEAPAAQRDTRGAIAAAAGIGHAAAVRECLHRLQRETGLTRVVVTGGNALHLPGAETRPWLVLDGLRELVTRGG